MATYLDGILRAHRARASRDDRDLAALRDEALQSPLPRPFLQALQTSTSELAVIAEVKRRSPIAGEIGGDLDPAAVASAYEIGGAACISVLTDEDHFGGSANDLQLARAATSLPFLRKDFTVAERDIYDARIMGADAVLLIVAALSDEELRLFAAVAVDCLLACLVEVHDVDEIERAAAIDAPLIGINQRDLHTFAVETERAVRLRGHLPSGIVAVAESGIQDANDARRLAEAGFDAVLVGSALVTSGDPVKAIGDLRSVRRVIKGRS